MKRNHLCIIRFGSTHLIRTDEVALMKLDITEDSGIFGATAVGVIMAVGTDLSIKEVSDAFKSAEKECGDTIPFVMFDITSNSAEYHLNFFKGDSAGIIDEYIKKFMGGKDIVKVDPPKKVEDMDLDDMLEKISNVGMEGLSPKEKERLKDLTLNP